jgi:nicotinamidase/pyrazinamidase
VKTVFFDVDTQLDFLYPAGALFVPGADGIVKSLAELTRFAASNGIQIVSTADAHTEDDPEFKMWKPHCVAGTTGQQKAAATLLSKPIILQNPREALEAPQIVVEKQKLDCFSNPKLRPLLELLNADRYVVYGVVTELCVRCASLGLLETGARVELVSDAIKRLNPTEEQKFFAEFQSRGGQLTIAAQVTG